MTELDDLEMISRGMYFRRDGTPYANMLEWAKDFEDFKDKRRVDETVLWWGARVSTVWLGLNHNYFGGKPLIFETMIFAPGTLNELDMDRYSTEAEAIAGHYAMCKAWKFPLWKFVQRYIDRIKWKIEFWRTKK